MESSLRSLAVHQNDWVLSGCIDVLCEEWDRSRSCREMMLKKSCDKLPYNIALVFASKENKKEIVIGHSRLSSVVAHPNYAFVESVVVKKSFRGKGIGRILMEETEKHALKLKIIELYLTTTDKESFYKHLGYTPCQPIVSIGAVAKRFSPSQLSRMFFGEKCEKNETEVTQKPVKTTTQPYIKHPEQSLLLPSFLPPPPLPTPSPPSLDPNNITISTPSPIPPTWLKKELI